MAKENIPCKTCNKVRMIDTAKFSVARYVKRSPNCRKCATKQPDLVNKISKGWFTREGSLGNKNAAGIIPWNKELKGIHLSPNSEFKKGQNTGENNNRWKGGITPINLKIRQSNEYRKWRKRVFERDNYTCQWCNERGGILHADHIKAFADYPELRVELSNGRTLCFSCHKKTDNYGMKNRKLCPSS